MLSFLSCLTPCIPSLAPHQKSKLPDEVVDSITTTISEVERILSNNSDAHSLKECLIDMLDKDDMLAFASTRYSIVLLCAIEENTLAA